MGVRNQDWMFSGFLECGKYGLKYSKCLFGKAKFFVSKTFNEFLLPTNHLKTGITIENDVKTRRMFRIQVKSNGYLHIWCILYTLYTSANL